jgi:ubiquinone/menaquinone biosynthesis C-methylase UbiE
MINRRMLVDFIATYAAQPATAFWRAIEVESIVEHGVPAGRGLDLGCGDGKLTALLLSYVGPRTLVGIDRDRSEVAAAARKSIYSHLYACSASAIPEPDGAFDFILANSVLEHIEDLDATLLECSRLLAPRGRFLFTVPGPALHDNLAGSWWPRTTRAQYIARFDRRNAHLRYLSPTEWVHRCTAHGLTVTRIRGVIGTRETRRWENLARFTSGLLFRLARGDRSPLSLQRTLGAKALQDRLSIPRWLAQLVASVLSLGLTGGRSEPLWRSTATASCLLVEAERMSAARHD